MNETFDLQEYLSEGVENLMFYVEYVPVSEETRELAPDDEIRAFLADRLTELRKNRPEMIYVSFPGDEKQSDGCLAAGRGFFHINSHGGAEPCPFSAFSDMNVRDTSLREAIGSGLFKALRSGPMLEDEHIGGCVLFEQREKVEQILEELKKNETEAVSL